MNYLEARPLNAQSMAASFVSPWIDARGMLFVKFQAQNSATGTPVGTYTLEGSNDSRTIDDGERWNSTVAASNVSGIVLVPTFEPAAGSGAVNGAFNTMLTVTNPPSWVRIRYTRTSGTGSASVFVTGAS